MRRIPTVCVGVRAFVHGVPSEHMYSQVPLMLPQEAAMGDRWYVTNGVVAVGPLAFDLLTRGVAHGRIPSSSLVRHEFWRVWRPLEDVSALSTADRQQMIEHFADISASADARASGPRNSPPPPPAAPSAEQLEEMAFPHEELPSRPGIRAAAVDPVGVLASAGSLDEAFLLALSTSATAASASVGLLHRAHADLGAPLTEYAHGPQAELLLGEKLSDDDPCVAAAKAGCTVIGEPRLGDVGRYVAGRIGRCIDNPRGVAMVPLHLYGKLVAMLEIGREARPFRACEIARVEDVVEALAERIVVAGWLE